MIGSIIVFLIVLSILILVHELGHFFAARRMGVWVEEFGLGIPPRAWGKKIRETIYSLNWLPFGGFVRLHGENEDDKVTKPEKSFRHKSKKARALIISAGVLMNFALAVVAFGIVYSFTGVPRESGKITVIGVSDGTPAAVSGIAENDQVLEVDGLTVSSTDEFTGAIADKLDQEVTLTVVSDTGEKTVSLVPRSDHPNDEGPVGFVIISSENYYPPLLLRPLYGIYYGFKEAIFWMLLVLRTFVMIFQSLLGGEVPAGISGPVGIYALTTEAASFGVLSLINFVGILSVNLMILNILPIPALDGGRLLFIGFETLFGRKIVPKVENYLHIGGFVLLILILVLITISDVTRLVTAGGVSGFLDSFTAP
ncbi:RIP metalloprotease [Patescibacteria group bacterium]